MRVAFGGISPGNPLYHLSVLSSIDNGMCRVQLIGSEACSWHGYTACVPKRVLEGAIRKFIEGRSYPEPYAMSLEIRSA